MKAEAGTPAALAVEGQLRRFVEQVVSIEYDVEAIVEQRRVTAVLVFALPRHVRSFNRARVQPPVAAVAVEDKRPSPGSPTRPGTSGSPGGGAGGGTGG